jgi:hypothetical protein
MRYAGTVTGATEIEQPDVYARAPVVKLSPAIAAILPFATTTIATYHLCPVFIQSPSPPSDRAPSRPGACTALDAMPA